MAALSIWGWLGVLATTFVNPLIDVGELSRPISQALPSEVNYRELVSQQLESAQFINDPRRLLAAYDEYARYLVQEGGEEKSRPQLSAIVYNASECTTPGQDQSYRVVVSNTGTTTARAISVQNLYPITMSLNEATVGAVHNEDEGLIRWEAQDLAPGGVLSWSFSLHTDQTAQLYLNHLTVYYLDEDGRLQVTLGEKSLSGSCSMLDSIKAFLAGRTLIKPSIVCDPADVGCQPDYTNRPDLGRNYQKALNPLRQPTVCSVHDKRLRQGLVTPCEDNMPELGLNFAEAIADVQPGDCRVLEDNRIIEPQFQDSLVRRGEEASPFLRPIASTSKDARGLVQANVLLGIEHEDFIYDVLTPKHTDGWYEIINIGRDVLAGGSSPDDAKGQLEEAREAAKEQLIQSQSELNEHYADIIDERRENYYLYICGSSSFSASACRASINARNAIEAACGIDSDGGLAGRIPGNEGRYRGMWNGRVNEYLNITHGKAIDLYSAAVDKYVNQLAAAIEAFEEGLDSEEQADFKAGEEQLIKAIKLVVENERPVLATDMVRAYNEHLKLDQTKDNDFRIDSFEPILDQSKEVVVSCVKEALFGAPDFYSVELTWCENGETPEPVILNENDKKPRLIEEDILLRLDDYSELTFGSSCSGRPGDPWWAGDCSCDCSEVVEIEEGSLQYCNPDEGYYTEGGGPPPPGWGPAPGIPEPYVMQMTPAPQGLIAGLLTAREARAQGFDNFVDVLSANPQVISQGGSTQVTVRLEVDEEVTEDVIVNLHTEPGTAEQGGVDGDYDYQQWSLVFAQAEINAAFADNGFIDKQITVTTRPFDGTIEDSQTFQVNVDPNLGIVGPAEDLGNWATIDIKDRMLVHIRDAAPVEEGDPGDEVFSVLKVELTNENGDRVLVNYGDVSLGLNISNGSANNGSDYSSNTIVPVKISSSDGGKKNVPIDIISDDDKEPPPQPEDFFAEITSIIIAPNSSGYSFPINEGDGLAKAIIIDDDEEEILPYVDVSCDTVEEGNPNTVTLTVIDPDTLQPTGDHDGIMVNIQTFDLTATSADDYIPRGPQGMPIFAGDSSQTFAVPTKEDTVPEPTEEYGIQELEAVGATLGLPIGVCTILDDDEEELPPTETPTTEPPAEPEIGVVISCGITREGNPHKVTLATVDPNSEELIAKEAPFDFSIDVQSRDDTARARLDYVQFDQKVDIATGSLGNSFNTDNTIDDLLIEPREFYLALINKNTLPDRVRLFEDEDIADCWILDNDVEEPTPPPSETPPTETPTVSPSPSPGITLGIECDEVVEGNSNTATVSVYDSDTLELTAAPTSFEVGVYTQDLNDGDVIIGFNSATEGVDYIPVQRKLTIAQGSSNSSFKIKTIDDGIPDHPKEYYYAIVDKFQVPDWIYAPGGLVAMCGIIDKPIPSPSPCFCPSPTPVPIIYHDIWVTSRAECLVNSQYLHHFDPVGFDPIDPSATPCVCPSASPSGEPISPGEISIQDSITVTEGEMARLTVTNTSEQDINGNASQIAGSAKAGDYDLWGSGTGTTFFTARANDPSDIIVRTLDDNEKEGTETMSVKFVSNDGSIVLTGTITILDND